MTDVLGPALECVNAFYVRMFRDWPQAVTRSINGYTLSYSGGTRLNGANHLWFHTPEALSGDALETAEAFFKPYRAAWSVVFTDSYMPQAADYLSQRSYFTRWTSPLMVLDHDPQLLAGRTDTPVLVATTREHLDAIGVVMSEAFSTGSEVNRRITRPEHLDDPAITHYVVYAGDEPAACATVVACGELAGIWNVGTRYKFRRQRFATTVMFGVLDDLRQRGFPVTVLMASHAGFPLYERMGYRTIGTTHYMAPPYINRVQW
ncbi:MAG: GNAT family N-acetyltransferase [Chloroflexi bacterium]|nr:GNAT family N-acetyltransferase [Chloroflexota bacterium]